MAVAWAKEYGLVSGDMVRYKERWEQGKVLWDFEFYLRKTTTEEDLTRPSRTNQRKKKGFTTWHALYNGTCRLKG